MKQEHKSIRAQAHKSAEEKLFRLPGRRKNNSGIILIVVLWVMVILSLLAVSLGRSTDIEITLVKNAIAKTKAKYCALGGIIYAMDQILKDSTDETAKKNDTRYYCGIPMEETQSAQELFKDRALADGSFDILYHEKNSDGEAVRYYGLRDEERKINLNAVTFQDASVLSSLIVLRGFDEQLAETIAMSVIDWKDQNDIPSHPLYGAEDDYYGGLALPYKCKNTFFDTLEELLLVRGMTPEIFQAIRDDVTVFPKEEYLNINFDTASKTVLQSLARGLSGPSTNTDLADADSLVLKLLDYRAGEDREEYTADDSIIELEEMPLNAGEKILFLVMARHRAKVSNFFSVSVKGMEGNHKSTARIEAVVRRDDLGVVYWRRD